MIKLMNECVKLRNRCCCSIQKCLKTTSKAEIGKEGEEKA